MFNIKKSVKKTLLTVLATSFVGGFLFSGQGVSAALTSDQIEKLRVISSTITNPHVNLTVCFDCDRSLEFCIALYIVLLPKQLPSEYDSNFKCISIGS